jgi:cell volume regulation protein A
VFVSLLPFKGYDRRDKMFVSWVGLRGAVPIIFAILALSNGVPQARLLFNTVFVCTLVSLIVQGTSLSFMAKKLKLSEDPTELGKVKDFDMEIADELKTILAELTISERVLTFGDRLLNLPLPENTLAVLVKRDDNYFVPNGKTELFLNDKVLLLSDDRESLMGALSQMGVKPEVNEDKMGFKGILGDLQDLAGDIKSGKFLKI